MAVKPHPKGTFDARHTGNGDNGAFAIHTHRPRAKQASTAAVSQASTFKVAAGEHAIATRMPAAPKVPAAPGSPGKGA